MRIALISDIHANLEALEAVLADINQQKVDELYCLGDVVGYGVNPNECAELVQKHCRTTILGNHDAAAIGLLSTQQFNVHARIAIDWTTANINPACGSFLNSLQMKVDNPLFSCVHATPYEPNMWYYITSLEEAAFNFQFFDSLTCFVGHTHIPIIIVFENGKDLYVHQDNSINFSSMPNARFLINTGSVGQPRDHNPQSCYGILDSDEKSFLFRRVTYDLQKTQAKMRKAKMPDFLISRLNEGR